MQPVENQEAASHDKQRNPNLNSQYAKINE